MPDYHPTLVMKCNTAQCEGETTIASTDSKITRFEKLYCPACQKKTRHWKKDYENLDTKILWKVKCKELLCEGTTLIQHTTSKFTIYQSVYCPFCGTRSDIEWFPVLDKK